MVGLSDAALLIAVHHADHVQITVIECEPPVILLVTLVVLTLAFISGLHYRHHLAEEEVALSSGGALAADSGHSQAVRDAHE